MTAQAPASERRAATTASADPRRLGPRWPLSARWRRVVLLTHIVSAGVWIGLDVVMGILVATLLVSGDDATKAAAAQALELFAIVPMATVALLTLATGLVLGLATKYGLLRFWWVLVKLVLNIALAALVLVALRGGVHEVADAGRALAAGAVRDIATGDMVFPPIVSTSALLFAAVLSVFKPWGRISKNGAGKNGKSRTGRDRARTQR